MNSQFLWKPQFKLLYFDFQNHSYLIKLYTPGDRLAPSPYYVTHDKSLTLSKSFSVFIYKAIIYSSSLEVKRSLPPQKLHIYCSSCLKHSSSSISLKNSTFPYSPRGPLYTLRLSWTYYLLVPKTLPFKTVILMSNRVCTALAFLGLSGSLLYLKNFPHCTTKSRHIKKKMLNK